MADIISSLFANAASHGDKTAVEFVSGSKRFSISYHDLANRAQFFASFMRASGVEDGKVVFIVLKHHAELYETFLGAMMAGFIPSFLPFATPKQDPDAYWGAHKNLFSRVEPGMIVTYRENVAAIRAALAPDAETIVTSIEDIASRQYPEFSPVDISAETTALLQHSSGTTGLKKGVMLSHGQIAAQIDSYSKTIDFNAQSIVASWLPLYHDMGLFSSFLMPIMCGATIISLDPFEWVAAPYSLFEAIEAYDATHCWMPNFAFSHIRRYAEALKPEPANLSSLKAIISCSEPVRAHTIEEFNEAFMGQGLAPTAAQACYAMAETVFAVSQSSANVTPRVVRVDPAAIREAHQRVIKVPEGGAEFVSNGASIEGIEVRIDTPDGPVNIIPGASSEHAGELQLRGGFVFSGYYRNPEQTATAFTEDGWYRTGDIGFADNGEIFICGRTKELMIVHGKNYYVGDVEQIVSTIEGIKPGRAVVFDVFDPKTDSDECVIMAETDVTDQVALRGIKRKIRESVAKRLTLQVRSIDLVDVGTLVKTTSGKMSRASNKEIWERDHAGLQ